MPAKPQENEFLSTVAKLFGEDVAIGIWKEFQGEQPYIPMFPKKEDPKQAYILEHYGKKPDRQIAKDLGISRRALQKRLNKPVKPKQITLF